MEGGEVGGDKDTGVTIPSSIPGTPPAPLRQLKRFLGLSFTSTFLGSSRKRPAPLGSGLTVPEAWARPLRRRIGENVLSTAIRVFAKGWEDPLYCYSGLEFLVSQSRPANGAEGVKLNVSVCAHAPTSPIP